MNHLPEKRMRGLARVLTKAFDDEGTQEDRSELRGRILDQALGKTGPRPQYDSLDLNDDTWGRISKIAEEKSLAPDLLDELLAMAPSEREAAVAMQPRFQTYSLASHALQLCSKAVFHEPASARELARLARTITGHADPSACGGAAALTDLYAYSLAMEGNALRVAGDMDGALALFEEARRTQEKGGVDPDLTARIDHLEASLRRELRQYSASFRLLDRAEKAFTALQDHDQKARTIINRSNVYLMQGDFEEAIASMRGALGVSCSPELAWTLRHNLIDILAKSGRPQEAAQLFEQTRPLYREHPDPLTTCRRIWVEGIIARELGNLELASGLLKQASEELAKHGYSAGAALAGLDLVAVYAMQDQAAEVLRVASDLVRLFQVRKAHPETLAALSLVHQAAQREAVSLSLLAQATAQIQKSGGMYETAAS
jgi:tetratricopeptide (TPR) repeat protein